MSEQPRGPDCPHCDGTGKIQSFAFLNRGEDWRTHTQEYVNADCNACAGYGHLHQWVLDQIAAGKKHRQQLQDNNESMRDAAQRLGISAAELSKAERGLTPLPTQED